MLAHRFGTISALRQVLLPKNGPSRAYSILKEPNAMERNHVRERRAVVLFFAILSGMSAVATAVMPAIA
jgi:hypothetical protein